MKLGQISPRAKQLWTVVYVEKVDTIAVLERDIAASLQGGADAVVLEISKEPAALALACAHVKKTMPGIKAGANFLGNDADPYGYINTFALVKEYGLDIAWTDFCGVDLVKEVPPADLHTIEAARPKAAFYCSGVHMKYGTLLDPSKTVEHSAQQAMGWVDGIIITGPKTGVATDPDRARRVREAVGSYPMGTASGTTAANFADIAKYVDFCLVNSSIADENHRILVDRVAELRRVMDR